MFIYFFFFYKYAHTKCIYPIKISFSGHACKVFYEALRDLCADFFLRMSNVTLIRKKKSAQVTNGNCTGGNFKLIQFVEIK